MTPLKFLFIFAYLHSGVNDSAVHIIAESMTPLCMDCIRRENRLCNHSGVNESAVHVTAESLTPLCMSQRCQWLCWIFFQNLHPSTAESLTPLWQKSAFTKSIFSAKTNPYWKRLLPVSQGPRGSCLMKKNRGRKSRVRVPLIKQQLTFSVAIFL
jgi:hypothetical protein